jgi:hypothetical protein
MRHGARPRRGFRQDELGGRQQINIIDTVSGKVAFPRTTLQVLDLP